MANREKCWTRSYLEERFDRLIRINRLPAPTSRDYPFHGWYFDFTWEPLLLAVEIDGGIHIGGNHVTPKGYIRDCRKNNKAQSEGWAVLRATPEMLDTEEFIQCLRETILLRINTKKRGGGHG